MKSVVSVGIFPSGAFASVPSVAFVTSAASATSFSAFFLSARLSFFFADLFAFFAFISFSRSASISAGVLLSSVYVSGGSGVSEGIGGVPCTGFWVGCFVAWDSAQSEEFCRLCFSRNSCAACSSRWKLLELELAGWVSDIGCFVGSVTVPRGSEKSEGTCWLTTVAGVGSFMGFVVTWGLLELEVIGWLSGAGFSIGCAATSGSLELEVADWSPAAGVATWGSLELEVPGWFSAASVGRPSMSAPWGSDAEVATVAGGLSDTGISVDGGMGVVGVEMSGGLLWSGTSSPGSEAVSV